MPEFSTMLDLQAQMMLLLAIGVFLDTIVICTLTGFVVIMGRMWTTAVSYTHLTLPTILRV